MEQSKIDELINGIKYAIKSDNISYYDFFRLKEIIKESPWNEGDEPSTDDLIEMLRGSYLTLHEKDELLHICDASDYYDLVEKNNRLQSSPLSPKTLDDEYRNEIVLKLLKVTSSTQELEELLGEDIMNKIKYLIL